MKIQSHYVNGTNHGGTIIASPGTLQHVFASAVTLSTPDLNLLYNQWHEEETGPRKKDQARKELEYLLENLLPV